MRQRAKWETPEFEPITDGGARASGGDIPTRNGTSSGSPPP